MAKLVFVLVFLGGLAFVGVILGVVYLKPRMRRRYERELQRKKHRH
jgi:uncharacterized membrane protein YciS (DUF1049 family)